MTGGDGGGMQIDNEGGGGGPRGPIDDLLRLQTDFQQRLAQETLRYLRQLQGLVGPTVPGTLVLPDGGAELRAEGSAGATVALAMEPENRQRVHCLLSPMLSPLVSERGVTWFPAASVEPPSVLLASGASARIGIAVPIPEGCPAGTYRGALVLHGFRDGALPVRITVTDPAADTMEPPA